MSTSSGLPGTVYGLRQQSTPPQDEADSAHAPTPQPTPGQEASSTTPPNQDKPTSCRLGREPELERPYPLNGMAARRYQGFTSSHPDEEVPAKYLQLSYQDKAAWAIRHTAAASEHHRRRIGAHMAGGRQPVIAVANSKSSTKTISALHLAMNISRDTQKFVVVMPTTMNKSTATVARMAGIDEDCRLPIRELHERIGDFDNYRTFSGRIPRMKNLNVGIIAEDPRGKKAQGYSPWEFLRIVLTILPNVDVLILDLANDEFDLEAESNIAYFAVRLAHALVLPYKSGDPVTKGTLADTVWELRDDTKPWEFDPSKAKLTPRHIRTLFESTGYTIPTPDKVTHATVVANIFKPGHKPADFARLMRPAEGSHIPQWKGYGHHVPADPYISRIDVDKKNEEEQIPPSNFTKIQPATDLAFLAVTGDTLDVAEDAEQLVRECSKPFAHLWAKAYASKTPDVIDGDLTLISPTRLRPESSRKEN